MTERNNVFANRELKEARERIDEIYYHLSRAVSLYPFNGTSNILTNAEIDQLRHNLLMARDYLNRMNELLPMTTLGNYRD